MINRRKFLETTMIGGISANLSNAGIKLNTHKEKYCLNRTKGDRNILVILCDQLRPDFLTMYGAKGIPTPNLDKLEKQGVVFDRAITQSTVCAPARASMMTGRFVSDHQVWANDLPFRDGVEFIAEQMNELGYATAAFGKLHHYPADDPKGFQHVRQMEEGRLGKDDHYFKWLQKRHPEVNRIWNSSNYTFAFSEEEYYEYWIASETIDYISNQKKSEPGQPFLAWVSFQGPHTPYDPPKEVKGTCDPDLIPDELHHDTEDASNFASVAYYRRIRDHEKQGMELKKIRVAYAEMIVEIDRQIGRIIDHLKKLDIYEQTTIIFSADHGDLLGDYGLNAKGPFPYRAQLDIPLLIANHPQIKCGKRSDNLAGNIDIPGTLLEIAGEDRSIGVSRSLLDLASKSPKHPREVNFSEFCDSIKTVEDKKYRFSYTPFTNEYQLFDLKNDPYLKTNLANKQEYAHICTRFLKDIIDFQILGKGVRVEAHDFVPKQQAGVQAKHPHYQRDFPVVFPLHSQELKRLKAAGLSTKYNEFCKGKKVLRHYLKPYWETEIQ